MRRACEACLDVQPCAIPSRHVDEVCRRLGILRAGHVRARLVRDRVDSHLGQPLLEFKMEWLKCGDTLVWW
ncbi:hypothetical protein ABZP36_011548 [Zizania latifolia]